MSTARPTCAVCGRPVDRLEEVEHYGRLRLIARCHGESEIVDLTDAEASSITLGQAFARSTKRLTS